MEIDSEPTVIVHTMQHAIETEGSSRTEAANGWSARHKEQKMKKQTIGARVWVIPDGYLPARSTGELKSHESTCVLNLGARPAMLDLVAYFEDREPLEGFRVVCPPRRTIHIRLDMLKNDRQESIPAGKPFALKLEGSERVVVQHTRLDSTQSALALMTTMAFPARV